MSWTILLPTLGSTMMTMPLSIILCNGTTFDISSSTAGWMIQSPPVVREMRMVDVRDRGRDVMTVSVGTERKRTRKNQVVEEANEV